MAAGLLAEGLALGASSGPACLAACGKPVLLPALAGGRQKTAGTGIVLTEFLSGRFAGYVVFAAVAWLAGRAFVLTPRARTIAFACADFAMAIMLCVTP